MIDPQGDGSLTTNRWERKAQIRDPLRQGSIGYRWFRDRIERDPLGSGLGMEVNGLEQSRHQARPCRRRVRNLAIAR